MISRLAEPADRALLLGFSCIEDGEEWDREVQDMVKDLPAWLGDRPGHQAMLFIHEGRLVGVVAFEPLRPGLPERGFYVAFGAVAAGLQARRLGVSMFQTMWNHFAERAPGGRVAFKVRAGNERSLRLCRGQELVPERRYGMRQTDVEFVETLPRAFTPIDVDGWPP